jgi:predicted AlkP superfamily phosphohydrolase/phosphomutase
MPSEPGQNTRVAALGLDSGDWRIIGRLLGSGKLPNLARLREQSAQCSIRSNTLYRTTLIWEAFLNGRHRNDDPRSSGVGFDPNTYQVFKIGASLTPVFFAGLPAGQAIAFDVPHLAWDSAARDIRVCTWGTHSHSSPRVSNPQWVLQEIDRAFEAHPAVRREHRYAWHQPEFAATLTRALAEGSMRRIEIAAWLQQKFPDWRLLLTVMSEAHSAGENFGHVVDSTHPLSRCALAETHRECLEQSYVSLDAAIGRFVESLPPDTVIVLFSLHGTAAASGELASIALLPELLHRWTLGKPLLRDPDQESWRKSPWPLSPAPAETWDEYMERQSVEAAVARLRRLASNRTEGLRWRLMEKLRTILGRSGGVASHSGLHWQVASWYRRRWRHMRMFALPSFLDGRIRINLAGRERFGIVDPGEYDRACGELERFLYECCNPRNGKPAVGRIMRLRQGDPMAQDGPDADLVVEWSSGVDALEHPQVGLVGPFPFRRTGEHTAEGFALFSGPGIRRADLGEHSVEDLPATLLALMGHELPAHLQGKPILTRIGAFR